MFSYANLDVEHATFSETYEYCSVRRVQAASQRLHRGPVHLWTGAVGRHGPL